MRQQVDWLTIAGLGTLFMPLLTMWHEIGGHAATCAILGGQVETIGAFYVDCTGLSALPNAAVECAGVAVNIALSLVAHAGWRHARGDLARLIWWLVWVSEALVATGYFCFSGVTGAGDLGTGPDGALAGASFPLAWRVGETALGILTYALVLRAGLGALNAMIGTGPGTVAVRRRIAHGFYIACGAGAVLVGLLNPIGLFVTIMSATASSFGGLAGFISIGFAASGADLPRNFVIERNWGVIAGGVLVLVAFALVLGPSVRP